MNKLTKHIACALAAIVLLSACSGKGGSKVAAAEGPVVEADSAVMVQPKYAKGFSVSYVPGMALVDISDPEGRSASEFHFALVPKGQSAEIPEGYTRIDTPVDNVICMTSLQLSNFIKLGISDKVSGITSTRHLFNPTVNAQLKSGITHKIGIEGNFDREVIMGINPDIILISPFKRGGYDALKDVDVPLVPHLGYKEMTPLGQAEWIKFVGLLTGNEALANQTFSEIETRYNELKSAVDSVTERPVVFSGEMRGGNWYAVGGHSFLAQIFKDAGADYFLRDNEESGGVTLDYETVYTQAAHAPYWRIVNSYDGDYSYDVLESTDNRYSYFDAFKNKGVIYCNMKQVPFYERMPVEPEKVLADFIAIFHPEVLPDHKPEYYHLLK